MTYRSKAWPACLHPIRRRHWGNARHGDMPTLEECLDCGALRVWPVERYNLSASWLLASHAEPDSD